MRTNQMQQSIAQFSQTRQEYIRGRVLNGNLSITVGPTNTGKSRALVGEFMSALLDRQERAQFFVWGSKSLTGADSDEDPFPMDVKYPVAAQVVSTAIELYTLVRSDKELCSFLSVKKRGHGFDTVRARHTD